MGTSKNENIARQRESWVVTLTSWVIKDVHYLVYRQALRQFDGVDLAQKFSGSHPHHCWQLWCMIVVILRLISISNSENCDADHGCGFFLILMAVVAVSADQGVVGSHEDSSGWWVLIMIAYVAAARTAPMWGRLTSWLKWVIMDLHYLMLTHYSSGWWALIIIA